jgi:hypothetical protein
MTGSFITSHLGKQGETMTDKTYRVTVQVTTEVVADNYNEAMHNAIEKVKNQVDDDGASPRDTIGFWVTGIACDETGYMVFEQN